MVFAFIATLCLFKDKLRPQSDLLTALYLIAAIEGLSELTIIVMMLVKFGLI